MFRSKTPPLVLAYLAGEASPGGIWVWREAPNSHASESSQKEGTAYSKTGLLCQLVPSLEMTFTLRLLFNIPPGQGRVLNGDKSLNYRFDEKSKSWRF